MKIRVGLAQGNSQVIEIKKDFNCINLKDVQKEFPNKRIIGWAKEI